MDKNPRDGHVYKEKEKVLVLTSHSYLIKYKGTHHSLSQKLLIQLEFSQQVVLL